jgi:deoxyribodipyrimidine photolyase
VHDHPALHAAVERASHVVRDFVLDDVLLADSPSRIAFLLEAQGRA